MVMHQQSGRVGSLVRLVPIIFAVVILPLAHAGESADTADLQDETVPLTDNDLRMITLAVMETRPLVASSPGVKYAEGSRNYQIFRDREGPTVTPGVDADVIFYPHTETAGIKEAYQVHCLRAHPDGPWTCPHVALRRYVRLDTQDFEVRVNGDVAFEAVLALVEA
jgi:hypothetical protein